MMRMARSVLDVTIGTLTVYSVAVVMIVMVVTFTVGLHGNVTNDVKRGVWCFKSVVCDMQELVVFDFNTVDWNK